MRLKTVHCVDWGRMVHLLVHNNNNNNNNKQAFFFTQGNQAAKYGAIFA